MGKKRKSGGRRKGRQGRSGTVQCSRCRRIVPADNAKKYAKRVSTVEPFRLNLSPVDGVII